MPAPLRALPALLLLPSLVGCFDSDGKDTSDTSVPPSGLPAPTARLSTGVSTVVVVDWTLDTPADRVWVEYGPNTGYGWEATERSGGGALLLGMPAETEVHYRLGAEFSGDVVYSDDQVITTGSLPSEVPAWTVEDSGEDFGDFVMTSVFNAGRGESMVLVLDRQGRVVWYTPPREGFSPAARPSRDGQAVLYIWDESIADTESAQICRFDLSGEAETCTDTPRAHHDFVELADGSLAYLREVTGSTDDYDLLGDQIVIQSPAGDATVLWDAFVDLEPIWTPDWDDHILPEGVDWTHANGLWLDEVSGDFFVSFYYFYTILRISGDTGRSVWGLGGLYNDFDITGAEFGPQHAPQWTPDGLVLFDNAQNGEDSRAVRFALDETAMTAVNDLSFPNPDGRHSAVLGDAHVLGNGYLVASFGDAGQLVAFSSEGTPVFEASPPPGISVGQVHAFSDWGALTPY